MGLGFGGAVPESGPADQIPVVLRRDRIERFGGGRQAQFGDIAGGNWRPRSMPSAIRKESSIRGSLMKPFQPVVVRGFSKYTRITI